MQKKQNKEDCRAFNNWVAHFDEWFEDLDQEGQRAADLWIGTGDYSAIVPFLPRPLAHYFHRRLNIPLLEEPHSRDEFVIERAFVVDFA